MSFYGPNSPGRGARAAARREAIESAVAGRRTIKEAARAEAIAEGRPLPRSLVSRWLDAVRRRHD